MLFLIQMNLHRLNLFQVLSLMLCTIMYSYCEYRHPQLHLIPRCQTPLLSFTPLVRWPVTVYNTKPGDPENRAHAASVLPTR